MDSERERDREKGLPLPLVHPLMAAAVARCGRRTALFRWQEPGASPGLLWGAGPKHLGHPPLPSRAIAESWLGRGATGIESGALTGTRTQCAGAARQRISLLSHSAGQDFLFFWHLHLAAC